jgi:hypothetical protein
MDLKQFYRKIRQVESEIVDQYPLVVSVATDDGGKPGILSEVPRYQAARMIVEGRVRLASEEEKQVHLEAAVAAQRAAEELQAARRLHLDLLLNPEPRLPAQKNKPSK